jgi:hypothetical protein
MLCHEYHLCVALPIKSLINIWVHKPQCTRFIFEWVIASHDFSGPRLRSRSFRFCVAILLLASYPCIVYPHIGDLTNLARYPPLKPNVIFCDYLLWPQPIIEDGSSIQGRSQDGANIEDFKYLSKRKVFPVPTLSLSPLCPRTSKRLSMEEDVGTM